jgi:hypothetical protein
LANIVAAEFDDRGLKDTIELLDEDCSCYTWRRGICASKLDYIFATVGMQSSIKSCRTEWFVHGSRFDHAALSVSFDLSANVRGRSYPKIYQSDIKDETASQWIRAQLQQVIEQIPDHWDPHMKYEFLKTMLRSKVLELRQMNKVEFSSVAIKQKLNDLLAIQSPDLAEVNQLKVTLAQAEENEQQILSIKAGIKWREAGERSTKYFLSKFKMRQEAAELRKLRDDQGTLITTIKDIIGHVKNFYCGLYRRSDPIARPDLDQDYESFFEYCPRLDPQQRVDMARLLTVEELKHALGTCTDSASGLDGIPYSFYKKFHDILLPYLLQSWDYAREIGQLPISQRRSCISLLPKKDKNLELLTNWRPISLSACDLKIITKAYSIRMKKVLPEIIHEAQAAYVPGRDISFNNRLLSLAKKYCKQADKDFCIISLDAKKAFDSVSHVYLSKVLRRYDFPEEFVRSFNLIYNLNEAVVQVNGHLSEPFSIQRGVKQGDALSCSLFVLAVDPLIRNIAANQNIEGLQIPISVNESVEIKVMAYADDITIICRNENLQPVFSDYELLSVLSGLELNADKTEILNLTDSPRTVSNVLYLGQHYALGRVDYIKICGIWIGDNVNDVYERNVQEKIKIMEGIILSWRRRFLSLNGRMILAKVFVLSQIVFVAQACAIKPKEIKKIEHLIYSFVNGNKLLYRPERIARKTLKAPKKEGGINGVDVDSFVKSIVLRQYVKALSSNRSLSAIQISNTSQNPL